MSTIRALLTTLTLTLLTIRISIQSTSDSNVTTDNRNVNENNSKSDNTNRNINESNSTQTINQNVKTEAPPASAIAPSIMSYSQDLCTVGRSGAFQGQVFGFSGGKTVEIKTVKD